EEVKRMQLIVNRGVTLLDALRHSRDEGSDPADVIKVMGTRAHIVSLLKQFMQEQQVAGEKLKKYETPSGILSYEFREGFKRFLAISALIILAMGLLLWAWVSRPFSRRLNTLVDNALRFQFRRELHPTLAGSDELAQLDTVFHIMAKERNEAEEM